MLLEMMIEKIAATEAEKKEEIDLLRRFQAGDSLAGRELKKRYSGSINSIINKFRKNNPNIPIDSYGPRVHKEFVNSLRRYDPDHTSTAALNTYLTTNLTGDLKKFTDEFRNETRMSAGDTINSVHVHNAKSILANEDITDPTDEDILNTINKDIGPKKITLSDVSRIGGKERKEKSGNVTLGSDGVGENIQVQDVMNVESMTAKDHLRQLDAKDTLDSMLGSLDPLDRDFYEEWKSIGKYKGAPVPKLLDVSHKRGFQTEYFGQKKISEIEKSMKGMIKNE